MRQPIDIAIRLRDARLRKGLSQKQAAKLSGVGEKTISTFESGWRTDSMKVSQLRALLDVYGISEARFFSDDYAADIAETHGGELGGAIVRALRRLPLDQASRMTCEILEALNVAARLARRMAA